MCLGLQDRTLVSYFIIREKTINLKDIFINRCLCKSNLHNTHESNNTKNGSSLIICFKKLEINFLTQIIYSSFQLSKIIKFSNPKT